MTDRALRRGGAGTARGQTAAEGTDAARAPSSERSGGPDTVPAVTSPPSGRSPVIAAIERARRGWEAQQPQLTFDPHVIYP